MYLAPHRAQTGVTGNTSLRFRFAAGADARIARTAWNFGTSTIGDHRAVNSRRTGFPPLSTLSYSSRPISAGFARKFLIAL